MECLLSILPKRSPSLRSLANQTVTSGRRAVPVSLSPQRRSKSAKSSRHDVRGNSIENSILLALPNKEFNLLLPKLKFMDLPIHTVLNEMAEPIESVYFMNAGLASIINVMSDGKSVEVGLTGREGFVGVPLTVGFLTSSARVLIQVKGQRFRDKRPRVSATCSQIVQCSAKCCSTSPRNLRCRQRKWRHATDCMKWMNGWLAGCL